MLIVIYSLLTNWSYYSDIKCVMVAVMASGLFFGVGAFHRSQCTKVEWLELFIFFKGNFFVAQWDKKLKRGSQLKKSSYILTKIPSKVPKSPHKVAKSQKKSQNPKINTKI